jgi:hypothetical protein
MKFEERLKEALESSNPIIALDLDKTLISNVDRSRASDLILNSTGHMVGLSDISSAFATACEENLGVTPLLNTKDIPGYSRKADLWTFPRPRRLQPETGPR